MGAGRLTDSGSELQRWNLLPRRSCRTWNRRRRAVRTFARRGPQPPAASTCSPEGPSGASCHGSSFSRFLTPGSAPRASSSVAAARPEECCRAQTTCRAVFPLNAWNRRPGISATPTAANAEAAKPTVALIAAAAEELLRRRRNSLSLASSAATCRQVRPLFKS